MFSFTTTSQNALKFSALTNLKDIYALIEVIKNTSL